MHAPSRDDVRAWVANRSLRRIAIRVAVAVAVLAVMGTLGFYAYFELLAHHAPDDVRESVRADANVSVSERYGGYVVSDADPGDEHLGLVFYPGGRVAPDAYLPMAAQVAERANVTVVVPEMRVNLAVLSPGRADAVVEGEPTVSRWVVGGHSLGGAMACRYAGSHGETVDGLLLVGSYCDRPVRELSALAVLGTRDAVLDRDRFAANRAFLPPDHTVRRIEGMNHSQAGWYTGQRGGQPARISTAAAHHRLAAVVAEWLCRDLDHCPDDRTDRQRDVTSSRTGPVGVPVR
ncbi:alpha/beta hydrolase [Halosimplex salinum]|uniref:alpha/beta hydrolase n=1 Tax=Halosimplex salinum TaxID=1710538 RepID=UPI001F363006|nr:alpha/beta hydrolase [Halosimplex salinum]